jgi:hypothetical protein
METDMNAKTPKLTRPMVVAMWNVLDLQDHDGATWWSRPAGLKGEPKCGTYVALMSRGLIGPEINGRHELTEAGREWIAEPLAAEATDAQLLMWLDRHNGLTIQQAWNADHLAAIVEHVERQLATDTKAEVA